MAPDDLDPVSKLKLGKIAQWIGISVIAMGVIGGILVVVVPTQGAAPDALRQNVMFALACCLAPSVLTAIPVMVVGRLMRRSAKSNDIGSLYRGRD